MDLLGQWAAKDIADDVTSYYDNYQKTGYLFGNKLTPEKEEAVHNELQSLNSLAAVGIQQFNNPRDEWQLRKYQGPFYKPDPYRHRSYEGRVVSALYPAYRYSPKRYRKPYKRTYKSPKRYNPRAYKRYTGQPRYQQPYSYHYKKTRRPVRTYNTRYSRPYYRRNYYRRY